MDNMEESKVTNKTLVHLLIGFAMKHRRIMQYYLDETGVYQAQHRLLMQISRNQNASQKDIADSMGISAATIAVSLKKLEKGGYINKVMDEGDNRFNQITLTDKGKQVVEQSIQIFENTDRKVFDGFTDEEKSILAALLQKLDDNLVKMEEDINLKKRGHKV
ncbi:MAG: MarR family transcriptional regulator [Clostridiales bacterium]|nr:MarR family transcriptional regulator [Clostridiales bacterium]